MGFRLFGFLGFRGFGCGGSIKADLAVILDGPGFRVEGAVEILFPL